MSSVNQLIFACEKYSGEPPISKRVWVKHGHENSRCKPVFSGKLRNKVVANKSLFKLLLG